MTTFDFFLLPGQPGSTLRKFFKKNFFSKIFFFLLKKFLNGPIRNVIVVKVKFEDLWFFYYQAVLAGHLDFLKNTNIQKSVEVWKSGSLNGFKCSNLLSVNEAKKFKNSGNSRILEVQEVQTEVEGSPKDVTVLNFSWAYRWKSVSVRLSVCLSVTVFPGNRSKDFSDFLHEVRHW